ncbi:MAG: hypothetical protein KAS99_06550 [Candidatus Omnitrophica bacterium]|nr:hypothetical protein [Candidatus Omnitrophota bacterium]
MGKNKLPLIIIFILLLICGFFAIYFNLEAQKFRTESISLNEENTELLEDKKEFAEKNNKLKAANAELNNSLKRLREKAGGMQSEIAKLERQNKKLEDKYRTIREEKDRAQKDMRIVSVKPVSGKKTLPRDVSSDYWEDVVRKKAELEASFVEINKHLLDTNLKISDLDKYNKELSIEIDQMTKEKGRLERELLFKERTLRVISKDLVNEREDRHKIFKEATDLRDENMDLKQELIFTNEEKSNIQQRLKNVLNRKDELERSMSEVEKVFKEKSFLFEQLKDELVSVLKADEASVSAVELPPIVVKPQEQQVQKSRVLSSPPLRRTMQGIVLAINPKDNFVIIDLGEDSGVTAGTRFNVFREDEVIGTIEVIETRKEISAADIKNITGGFSIRENDEVISK